MYEPLHLYVQQVTSLASLKLRHRRHERRKKYYNIKIIITDTIIRFSICDNIESLTII